MGCAIQEIVNENPKATKNHYSQHHQQTPTTLKSQHTALVKLLESAPITGSKSKTVTNYASPRQQQKTTTQQPQQIKSNNDTSSIRISNSNVNVCDVVSKTNSCLSNKNQKNDHESGIDEDIGDDSDKTNFKLINTKNQCPWKKIRYAREWKQRELLSDENSNNSNLNEISKCDNTELTKRLIMDDQDTKHHKQQQQHHQQTQQPQPHDNIQNSHHNHNHHNQQQQPDDIASQMHQHHQQMQQQHQNQSHRRDSSDSNSSVASLSCTCSNNIPQDNEDDCECQQDSGCDDEMNGSNGTMNYLCQKFNDVIYFNFKVEDFR